MQSHVVQSQKKATKDAKDWKDTIQIGNELQDKRHEVLQVLEPLQNMWDCHLGLMSNASHKTDW